MNRRHIVAFFALKAVIVCAVVAPVSAMAGSTPNLVKNGDFRHDVSGWFSSTGDSVSRVPDGYRSNGAASVRNAGQSAKTVVLNDEVNSIRNAWLNATYVASARVRVAEPKQSVNLRLMEISTKASAQGKTDYSIEGEANKSVYLQDAEWHELTVRLKTSKAGSDIDLNVLSWNLPPGKAFEVDTIRLTRETPAAPSTSTSAVQPSKGKLVWSDEFNGSAVDPAKWNVRNSTYWADDEACLTNNPRNVSVGDGVLTINAQRETYQCTRNMTKLFTSGYLDTMRKQSWKYGYFEMRAKVPVQENTSKGFWPAFWLRPDDATTGEIDILEARGSGAGERSFASTAHQAIHHDYTGTPHQESDYVMPNGKQLSDGFHTYAVDWTPERLTWYVDGVKVWERTPATTSWFASDFNKPYNIRLNMQVGGSWVGTPNAATDFSQGYEVDYIRVYQ